jgi:MSHA biogenesis protein MshL
MKPRFLAAPMLALTVVGGCTHAPTATISPGHIDASTAIESPKGGIPLPVQNTITPPKPRPTAKAETYSVVVNNIPVHDLLFALARDAKLNVDVHPGLTGLVTLNAIDQTLPQLLARIAKQIDMRWEMDGANLTVMPDKPFLRTYQIDFLNMSRNVKSTVDTSTQIASAQTGSGSSAAQSGASGGNTATTSVTSDTKNDLMQSLINNVTDMLKEEDRLRYRHQIDAEVDVRAKTVGDGTISAGMTTGGAAAAVAPNSAAVARTGPGGFVSGSGNQEAANRSAAKEKVGDYELAVSVFANKESGVLFVRATSRQHEKVQQFIDQVMRTAKRQVLIEATIAEVTLSDGYKQGIDWSAAPLGGKGFTVTQAGTTGLATNNPLNILTLAYNNATSRYGNIAAQIDLLQSFGNVRVLSSPKLSVMNNQTATLKVADSRVYFTVKSDTLISVNGSGSQTFTTTANAVSVGFFMTVTPQINDAEEVTLNVRPTVTRILGYVNDPNPALANAGVVNQVPEIQTREMESIIRIPSGQIAVMGGLMQDEVSDKTDAVPLISAIPVVGEFFKHRNDGTKKTELVVFLRPIVIKDASLNGDYSAFRKQLPKEDFFDRKEMPATQLNINGDRQ